MIARIARQITAALLILTATACAPEPPKIDATVALVKCRNEVAHGQPPAANAACSVAIVSATNPEQKHEALLLRARALAMAGSLDDARRDVRAVLESNPRHVQALIEWANLKRANDLPGARAEIDRAIALAPNDARAHLIKGRILLDGAETKAAIVELTEATRLDPTDMEARAERAFLLKSARPADSIADFDTLLAADPSSLNVRMNRGLANLYARKYREAIADLTPVLDQEPCWLPPRLGRARARRSLNDWAGALDDLSAAKRCAPNWLPALAERVVLYSDRSRVSHDLRHLEEGLDEANSLVARYPWETLPYFARASVYQEYAQEPSRAYHYRELALRDVDHALALDPDDALLWSLRGQLLFTRDTVEESIKTLRHGLEVARDTYDAYAEASLEDNLRRAEHYVAEREIGLVLCGDGARVKTTAECDGHKPLPVAEFMRRIQSGEIKVPFAQQ